MRYAGRLRKTLWNVVDNICSERDKYFISPDKDFTRKGKFKPQDTFKALLLMQDRSLSHELLDYFNYKKNFPTTSAFVQARAKIKQEAFKALFYRFVSETSDNHKKYLYKGYRLLAVDGSDSHVPSNPDDAHSYFPNPNGRQYNLFHINAMYDLLRHTYTDVMIRKKRTTNERTAFIEMIEKHRSDDIPIIFIADRGYESYNDMAHIIETGNKFLIRVQDIDGRGIDAGLGLPDRYFDVSVTLKLIRRQTYEIAQMRKLDNRIKHITTEFDYLPRNYDRFAPTQFYELPVRIVRFKVKDTYEVIMTNLPQDSFPPIEINKLYGMRWGIETSFRDLKHTIGLNYYHSKKIDSINNMLVDDKLELVRNSSMNGCFGSTGTKPVMFNDDQWIYIPNDTFSAICEKMTLVDTVGSVRKALHSAGWLRTSEDNMTYKATLYDTRYRGKLHVTAVTSSILSDEAMNTQKGGMFNFIPCKDTENERILLGTDEHGINVYWSINRCDLNNTHMIVNGRSGTGKTTAVNLIAKELFNKNKQIVYVDFSHSNTPKKMKINGFNE